MNFSFFPSDLGRVSRWLDFAQGAYIAAMAGTVIFTLTIVILSKKHSALKDEEFNKYKVRTEADTRERIAHVESDARERIAMVESNAKTESKRIESEAAQHIEEAKSEAARAIEGTKKLETANLQLRLDLESEQRRNAEAQKAAAEAQLALRHNIEYSATPRRIIMGSRNNDEAVRGAKFKELEKYLGTPAIILFVNDGEAKHLAFDIQHALLQSKWASVSIGEVPATIPLGFIEPGVQVRTLENINLGPGGPLPPKDFVVPPKVKAIVDLLSLDLGPPVGPVMGVMWQPDAVFGDGTAIGLTRYGFKYPDGAVVITVGEKPTLQFLWTHDIPTPVK